MYSAAISSWTPPTSPTIVTNPVCGSSPKRRRRSGRSVRTTGSAPIPTTVLGATPALARIPPSSYESVPLREMTPAGPPVLGKRFPGMIPILASPTVRIPGVVGPSNVAPSPRASLFMSMVSWVVGGEALPPPLARELRARVGWLGNVYGPTETTVWSTLWPVPRAAAAVAIGRPIANTRVYVLDERLDPLPVGVPGQLYIGGAGVARGYHHRPAVTAERFMPDPYGPAGGRLYATGDRARWRADGQLEFLGRADNQVKLRGHRVELGEIEARLLEHPAVAEAAVIGHGDGDDHRLVAYLVCRTAAPPATGELRRHLAGTLPAYMLPSDFVGMDRLPLTPGGK